MALKDVGARFVVQGESAFVGSMGRADASMARVGSSAQSMGVGVRLGLTAAAAGATAIGVGLLYAEHAAREFESSFAGVRKTVDGTEAELQVIKQAFIDMSLAIPVSANELNRIGEAAGQLGVAKENIVEFTRVAAEMGIATNLSSDEAATSMARLANIVQLPQEQFRQLGSAVVDLGNHSAATESDILNMSLRLAGAGHIIGLTTPEILGMATALSSVGIEAESGGTAFSRVFVEIANNVKSGGEKLDLFAAISGETTAAFKKQFETDASGAIIAFVRGLDNINRSGGNVFETLDALELGEIRVRDALLRSAGAGDILEDSVKRGTQAFSDNSALTNEVNKRYETTESQLIKARNAMDEAARSLGEKLQPAELEATKAGTAFLNDFVIPLVETYGPPFGKFLLDSEQGWKRFADVINNDDIPAMTKVLGLLQAIVNLNPFATLAKGGFGILGEMGTAFKDAFTNTDMEGYGAGVRNVGEAAEDAGVAIAGWGDNLQASGEQAEIAGRSFKGIGEQVFNVGTAAAKANPDVARLTKSLLDDGDASKGVATAKQLEAEARRAAAEAMRLEEERLEKLRLARVRIVNEIAADSARNQAGVALNSGKNPRMEDLNLGIEALDKATEVSGDASVALGLIDKSLGEFSGVLSTLTGDDLASAGAVMEGFHRLKTAFTDGRIEAVEYIAGLKALTGELGVYVTKALDAAAEATAAQKKANEDALALYEERAKAETDQQNNVLTELGRIEDAKYEQVRENNERLKKLAADRAKYEMDAAMAVANFEIAEGERSNARRQAQRDRGQALHDALVAFGAAGFQSQTSIGAEAIPALKAIAEKYGLSIGELIQKLQNNAFSFGFDTGAIHVPTAAELFGQSLGGQVALPVGAGSGGSGSGGTTINVTANYSDPQEPQSILMDLQAIAMAVT